MVRWPEESEGLDRLRAAGVPRLLIIPPGVAAPAGGDCEEDWIRLPADDEDVRVRLSALASRAGRHHRARPAIDDHGVMTFGERAVTLSPLKAAVAAVLVASFGQAVSREDLLAAWPSDEEVTPNALRIQILRLRRRLQPLGLEVRALPRFGYRLERAAS